MRVAPLLGPIQQGRSIRRRYALLINPFYPKDPHASFGKHVLTPTLALTTVAGATPQSWDVSYWDENLLQGPPPREPLPEVVGITVHLTFAQRAFELARWYRDQGTKVILGGLHVISCADECAPHANAPVLHTVIPAIHAVIPARPRHSRAPRRHSRAGGNPDIDEFE